MKILVLSNLYPPYQLGGYEIGCRNVVNGLRRLGHEVLVLTTPSHIGPLKREDGVFRQLELSSFQPSPVENTGWRAAMRLDAMASNFTNTAALLYMISEFQPDCIYLFNLVGIGGLGLIDCLNTLKFPWIFHLMDRVPDLLQRDFPESILSLFNAVDGRIYQSGQIISMTNHLIAEIEMHCGFKLKKNIKLVPGWVEATAPVTKRNYANKGTVRFVTAGAIQPHKGIDIILEACALLLKEKIIDFSIDIYGQGMESHYIDKSKQLGVHNHVNFCGTRTQLELLDIYKEADAFLFPTWEREPFGFAPIEAASVGCVPIITDTCGVAERLVGGVHCIKIQRDADSLFNIMIKICKHEIDLTEMSRAGQAICRQDLSFDTCLREIEKILQQSILDRCARRLPTSADINLAYLKHNMARRIMSTH